MLDEALSVGTRELMGLEYVAAVLLQLAKPFEGPR